MAQGIYKYKYSILNQRQLPKKNHRIFAVQEDTHPKPFWFGTCHALNLHGILSLTESISLNKTSLHSSALPTQPPVPVCVSDRVSLFFSADIYGAWSLHYKQNDVVQRRIMDDGGAGESARCSREAEPEGVGLSHKVTDWTGGCWLGWSGNTMGGSRGWFKRLRKLQASSKLIWFRCFYLFSKIN